MPIGGHLYCLYMPPSDQLSTSLFHQWPKYYHGTVQSLQLGVCNEPPTHQNRPDPTQLGGLGWFLRVGRLGWIMTFFFNGESGWVQVIRFTNPPNPFQPTYI